MPSSLLSRVYQLRQRQQMSSGGEVFYVVDRFERSLAVLSSDSGEEHSVLVGKLPRGLRDGDVLRTGQYSNGEPNWTTARLDRGETERRKHEARDILQELRRRDPGGDIAI